MENNSENMLFGLLFIAAGIFAILGASMQWSLFMNDRKALALQKIFGRTGTRVFYIILGLILITLGIMVALGVDQVGG